MGPQLIKNFHASDLRGSFTKIFSNMKYNGQEIQFKESFFSHNKAGTWRGLHFQSPPMDHWKLISVVKGNIIDYIVDIRKNSPYYTKTYKFDLKETKESLLIPPGFAHGFFSKDDSIVLYNVDKAYSPDHDKGLSFQYLNDLELNPIYISKRDLNFTKNIEDVSW